MINLVLTMKTGYKQDNGLTELPNMILERIKYVPGCLQAEIWNKKDSGIMILFETWVSMSEFKNHIHSPIYKWMLVAIDLSAGEPLIRFSECENPGGIEMIRKIMTEKEINPLISATE